MRIYRFNTGYHLLVRMKTQVHSKASNTFYSTVLDHKAAGAFHKITLPFDSLSFKNINEVVNFKRCPTNRSQLIASTSPGSIDYLVVF